jgi:hypothetical protein
VGLSLARPRATLVGDPHPRSDAMDSAQMFVFDLGWLFFAVWGTILAALGVVAFGNDIAAFTHRKDHPNQQRQN